VFSPTIFGILLVEMGYKFQVSILITYQLFQEKTFFAGVFPMESAALDNTFTLLPNKWQSYCESSLAENG
jgi:hypothetical protein